MQNSQIDGYLKWTPKRNSVSTEKYIATFKVKAKDEECSDTFDLCDEVEEEFKIKILVVSKDKRIDTSLNTTFNSNKEFTNDVKFDFTPELNLDFKIENGDLSSAKVELTGVLDFGVLTKFKYDVSKKTNYNKRLVNKIYKRVYLLGEVPVYQEIKFTLDAKLEATASSEIEATSDLDTKFTIKAGMEYKNESWSPIASKEFEKEYLASIELAGGVNLKVRLIPNMEIEFYKVASAGLSIEPWATGNLKATAISELKTDFENYDFLGVHKMEKLDIDVGIDANVYADLSIWKINLAHYPSGGGKKTIFEPNWKIFSLPEIKLSSSSENSCEIKADITDGVNNKLENLSWFIFPDYGATITSNGSDSATLNFDEDGEYEVYLVGNSDVLGEYLGKEYNSIVVNSSDCSKESTLSDGLVAHYEFEGNANDSSGNNNHGTEHGGVLM